MTFEQGVTEINQSFMEMLNDAEKLFGERDKKWTYIGIEFREDGPYIYHYPEKRICIVLSSDCSKNFVQLYYQLAHETCHLLYPTGKADANILNEGISTYFSKVYQEKRYPDSTYAIDCIGKSKYFEAFKLVEQLLEIDKEIIIKLRKFNSNISYITKSDFEKLDVKIEDKIVDRLIQKF